MRFIDCNGQVLFFLLIGMAALVTTSGCQADIEALKSQDVLTSTQQQHLAQGLLQQLFDADEDQLELFEANYKIILEKCPDTEQAEIAAHRLTNLYQSGFDEPRHAEIASVLEKYLAQRRELNQPIPPKYGEALLEFSPVDRLHQSYVELGQYEEIVAYYQAIGDLKDLSHFDVFDYADALDNTGDTTEAAKIYRQFLDRVSEEDGVEFLVTSAKERLEEIEK